MIITPKLRGYEILLVKLCMQREACDRFLCVEREWRSTYTGTEK